MNALINTLAIKKNKLFSVFFTAGYPELDSTAETILALQNHDVDFVEIGMPYSDPLADGPVIQQTNMVAIRNGMTIGELFEQLEKIKHQIRIPLVLMGYLNPVLQYGMESFCNKAHACGISGIILPDLPLSEYEQQYAALFKKYQLSPVFLVTPTSSPERIRQIDLLSEAFIYAVSASSITGSPLSGQASQEAELARAREEKQRYFLHLQSLGLRHPVVAGFGIHDRETLADAWKYTSGAIIGTAFLKLLGSGHKPSEAVSLLKTHVGA